MIMVDFGTKHAKGDLISATFRYDGQIDNHLCYLATLLQQVPSFIKSFCST